jgi:L-amino acid N-acyltransferase YncA
VLLTIECRRARPEDAEAIAELLGRASAASPFLGDYHLKPAVEPLRVLLRPEETRLVAVVAVGGGGQVAGYAHAAGGVPSTMRHVATVAVAVDEPFRRQGIGLRMLNLLAAETRRIGWYRLRASVWADNQASIALFYRAGFQLDAVIPEQLKSPDGTLVDEWVFGLRLKADTAGSRDPP